METLLASRLPTWVAFGVLCLFPFSAQAGLDVAPNVLVEPGGVEVPLLVNVLGPEDPADVSEVQQIIREANRILAPANVQLSVFRLYADIEIGDGDRRIAAAEAGEVLLGSLFELTGTPFANGAAEGSIGDASASRYHGPGKGIKLNIADDIWVEEPQRVYLDWGILPVAFLERAGSPQETARNLVYGLALTLRVPGSLDPANLMFTGGTGTTLDSGQAGMILDGVRPIGMQRSSYADGFAPELLWALHHGSRRGALFHSEGQGWTADFLGDVYYDRAGESGFGSSDVDLVYLKMGTGSPLMPIEQRHLIVKAVLHTTAFPDSAGIDLYLSALGGGAEDPVDLPDFFNEAQSIIGFGRGFAGYVEPGGDGQWHPLAGAAVQTTVLGGFTQLKVEIPFADLQGALPGPVYGALTNGGPLRFAGETSVFGFDGNDVSFEDDLTPTTAMVEPVPMPLPRIEPDARITGPGSGTPGVWAWGGNAQHPFEITPENVEDFERDFFAGVIPLTEQGTRTSTQVNFYDSSDHTGAFDSRNGFADETFPGIDGFVASPGNPADGDDDDYFGIQAVTVVDFPAGLNILGIDISDNMGFCLDIGGTTVGHFLHGLLPEDDGQGSSDLSDGDEDALLTRHDCVFHVEHPGRYVLRLQVLHTTGGASAELHHVLPNGTRILGGDTVNGGMAFEVPSQEIIDETLPD
jgi:hypothetical protein